MPYLFLPQGRDRSHNPDASVPAAVDRPARHIVRSRRIVLQPFCLAEGLE